MALIRTLTAAQMQRNSVHDEVEATYVSFDLDGQRYLQIDSYGRLDREVSGKKSQSVQLDRQSAVALVDILRHEFGID